MNKLIPATSLLWALLKSRVYDWDYDVHVDRLILHQRGSVDGDNRTISIQWKRYSTHRVQPAYFATIGTSRNVFSLI